MVRGPKTALSPDSLEYLANLAGQDEVLARVERETSEMPRSMMQVSPDQGALLQVLVAAVGAKNALEVGTFTGYSAICMARGLADGGRLICLELSEEFAGMAQRNVEDAGVADRVEIRVGPAKESLEAIPAERAFDVAFIDADKPGYPEYYELVLERMRPGGLVLLDNMLQGGRVVEPETESARVIDELNRRIHADERVDMAMTMAADGLTFVRVR